jgi:hypothetical protein
LVALASMHPSTGARQEPSSLLGRCHRHFREQNRRGIGKSQSKWNRFQDGNARWLTRSRSRSSPPSWGRCSPSCWPARRPRRRCRRHRRRRRPRGPAPPGRPPCGRGRACWRRAAGGSPPRVGGRLWAGHTSASASSTRGQHAQRRAGRRTTRTVQRWDCPNHRPACHPPHKCTRSGAHGRGGGGERREAEAVRAAVPLCHSAPVPVCARVCVCVCLTRVVARRADTAVGVRGEVVVVDAAQLHGAEVGGLERPRRQ